jgi:molecular chaperone GrpE
MTTEPMQDAADAATRDTDKDMPAQDELEALRGEVEQLRAQSLVERADLENQRKRLERDVCGVCCFEGRVTGIGEH